MRQASGGTIYFIPEISGYLEDAGLSPRFYFCWMKDAPPVDTTWYICCGAVNAKEAP